MGQGNVFTGVSVHRGMSASGSKDVFVIEQQAGGKHPTECFVVWQGFLLKTAGK